MLRYVARAKPELILHMNILILGDIFGSPGRSCVKNFLPGLKKQYKIDLCVANVENLTHGKGFSPKHIEEVRATGVDFCTSGNHAWKKKEGADKMDNKTFPVIRPANYPKGASGRGWQILKIKNARRARPTTSKVLVINLSGQVFMPDHVDNPFHAADAILKAAKKVAVILIDVHAEATAEKIALAFYLEGRVSLVYGTHTHVPTKDSRILKGGTGFISDVGFTGPIDSIIGLDKKNIIHKCLTGMPVAHEIAEGPSVFNALFVRIDEKTGKCLHIEHIQHEEK